MTAKLTNAQQPAPTPLILANALSGSENLVIWRGGTIVAAGRSDISDTLQHMVIAANAHEALVALLERAREELRLIYMKDCLAGLRCRFAF